MSAAAAVHKALVVDDDSRTGPAYCKRLTQDGYHVTSVSDPMVALAMAKNATPNMIFVHLGRAASGSGSMAFMAALRTADDTRHIPVTVLSSYFNPALERLGLRAIGRGTW